MDSEKDTLLRNEKERRLDSLREQLYARGVKDPDLGFTDLEKTPHITNAVVSPVWQEVRDETNERSERPIEATPSRSPFVAHTIQSSSTNSMLKTHKRRKVRQLFLAGGALFFIVAAILASTYLFFGKNSISGNNITLDARGPFAVGGGEKFNFTVSLTNQNVVAIDSATLIIEYPQGTQSATDKGKGTPRERKAIDRIGPGEVLNIPLSAIMFGEENDEKEIRVTIEYRVQGSNATFYRDATPLHFKISSSPVTMTVDAVNKITSGQDIDLAVTLSSNSPTPLKGLLLKAEYPTGFSFTTSDPKTVAGEDSWRINELKPEQKQTIHIKGQMAGNNPEKKIFKFSSGVANEKDPYILSSIFTATTHEVGLEAAFVNLEMTVNGKGGEIVSLASREAALVQVTFRNTLPDTIHSAVIEIELSGNAIDKPTVSAGTGFYDSSKNVITWDSVASDGLKEIIPGGSETVTFSFTPTISSQNSRTPQVVAKVNVKGRRVSENNVPESLTGTMSRTVKVESETALSSQVFYSTGPFANAGPLPPIAETPTTYTIIMAYANGTNALSNAVVEAVLPPYVTWKNEIQTPAGAVTYNASTRMLTWKIGDIDAGRTVGAAYKVSILPSVSQAGTVPALILQQRARAQDRFTSTLLRSTAPDLTTQLSDESDETKQEGRVINKSN